MSAADGTDATLTCLLCVTCCRGCLLGGKAERRHVLRHGCASGYPLASAFSTPGLPSRGPALIRALARGCPGHGLSQAWPSFWLVAGKVQQAAPGVTLTLRTSWTKGPLPVPAKGDSHLFRICPWSWGQGLSLPRHTEPGLDTWRKALPCDLSPKATVPRRGGSGERADRAAQRVRPPRERKMAQSAEPSRMRGGGDTTGP